MRYYILPVMLLCVHHSVSAKVWTYPDCVDYAREHSITLQKSQLNEKTSEYNLEEAKGQWQPTLDFSTLHGFTNYPWGTGKKNGYDSSYGLSAGWTVWNGGKRENSIKQNELRLQRAKIETLDLFRTLETDLLQVYINILYVKESITIYEEALKLSEAQEERGRLLAESGKLSKVDYAQLQSQCEQDRYSLVNARSTYDSRIMELKELLELGISNDISLADIEWTDKEVLSALPPMSESYDLALATDLRIQGLRIDKSTSDFDISIAKADRMPDISLRAGVGTGYYAPGESFGKAMKQGVNETVGLTISVPILDNRKSKMAIARAKVASLEAQLDIDRRETEIAQIVEKWYIDTQSAQAKFVVAVSQLESANLSYELTNERFSLGYINTIELMTAHNDYIEARQVLLQSRYMAMLGQKMIEYYRNATVTLP